MEDSSLHTGLTLDMDELAVDEATKTLDDSTHTVISSESESDHEDDEDFVPEVRKKAVEAHSPTPEVMSNDKFKKLNALLEKTAIYSKFLGDKINPEENENEDAYEDASDKKKRKRAPKKKEGSKKLKSMMENSTAADGSVKYQQPDLLTGASMRHYQLVGMNWLISLYENGVNGILADEMGLGKTIQTISAVAHLCEKGVWGPFLVVAPLSTLANWINEFSKFTPEIPVLMYHGSKDERASMRAKFMTSKKTHAKKSRKSNDDRDLCVIVTSFDIAIRDRKYLSSFVWKYLIVDEAHRLKNFDCKLIRELRSLKSENRLLLTGTPLQNNLTELWSLLNFLLPDVFDDLQSFQSWFDFSGVGTKETNKQIILQEQQNQLVTKLHSILKPFLLRRLKTDVDLSIPKKKEIILYTPLSPLQMKYYEAIRQKKLTPYLLNGAKKVSLNNIMMQLRKVCNHPYLFQEHDENDPNADDMDMEAQIAEEVAKNVICISESDSEDDDGKKKLKKKKTRSMAAEEKRKTDEVTKKVKAAMQAKKNRAPKSDEELSEDLINSSGKMILLHRMLPELQKRGHRVLIFSQFTSMMDILEDYLESEGYEFCRIDGQMAQPDRQAQIVDFNTDKNKFVFLLSTRAGGLGINLTSADTVIIYDSDWNPQMDLQAQDRCHRIGQTKNVIVYRYITANSIESKMVQRANSKLKLERLVIKQGAFKNTSSSEKAMASREYLLEILKDESIDNQAGQGRGISDEELKRMLDREQIFKDEQNASSTAARDSDDNNNNNNNSNNNANKGYEVLDEVVAEEF